MSPLKSLEIDLRCGQETNVFSDWDKQRAVEDKVLVTERGVSLEQAMCLV
jgi:hypothetical protein